MRICENYKESSECCLPKIKIRYKDGTIKVFPFGIRRLGYSNELVLSEAWGYNKGHKDDLNDPANYEIIEIEGWERKK
jgi:hypothetical protein